MSQETTSTAAVNVSSVEQATPVADTANPSPSGDVVNMKMGSLDAFKKAAPEVYHQMMQGIAMNICNDMKHQQERFKKAWRAGNGG